MPQPKHDQNEKVRHRTKGRRKDIDSNVVSKFGSHESQRDSRLKNDGKDLWDNRRSNQKNKHRNISTTKVPKFGVLTKFKSINDDDDEYGASNQVTYNSILEDELDGLEALEDPKQKSEQNLNPNGFPFGSNASCFQKQNLIIFLLILTNSYHIMCM